MTPQPAKSSTHRRYLHVAVCAVTALFVLYCFVHLAFDVGRATERDAYERLRRFSEAEGRKGCLQVASSSRRSCEADQLEKQREARLRSEEVTAQVAASSWSFWAAVIAAAQLPVSALGLFALLRSLGHSRRALDIAAEANRLNNDTARRQMRAYVGIDRIETVRNVNEAGEVYSYDVFVIWKNYGATPATGVDMFIHGLSWHAPSFPPWFPYPRLPSLWQTFTRPESTIQPKSELRWCAVSIDADDLHAHREGWMKLYWWGELSYGDVYGNSYRQRYRRRSRGYLFKEDRTLERVDFGYVANDSGGNEEIDALSEDLADLPAEVETYVSQRGWHVWLQSQLPANWEISPDGTPHEQNEEAYRLKPSAMWIGNSY